MSNFNDLKFAVEALSGGKNTVLFDDAVDADREGIPSIMVRIPMFHSLHVLDGTPDSPHPMFVVDDSTLPEVYFSKYQNTVVNGKAYSLPFKDPHVFVTFEQAKQFAEAKGKGWHLATNAEYAGIALWCLKNGFMPHGNNCGGGDHAHSHEKGVVTFTSEDGAKGRVATGSGPVTWNHDGTLAGICDLNGNVWEWTGGFRMKNGEIQIIPQNNAAKHIDQGVDSEHWKAILQDGSLVAPGTANTLKIDSTVAGSAEQKMAIVDGAPIISTTRVNCAYTGGDVDDTYGAQSLPFESLAAKEGVTVPALLKVLGIAPPGVALGGGSMIVRNYGERLLLRGGSWHSRGGAGLFALRLDGPRTDSAFHLGFRTAFVKL